MKPIELFCCLVVLATFTSGVKFHCDYYERENHYNCFAVVISADNPTTITEIRGNHMAGKGNADVKRVLIHYNPLATIPNGLGNFFPNLEVLHWSLGKISSIDSNTFKQFPNLLNISLSSHKLVTLDGDLFKHTRKLRQIDFSFNKLEHVGHNLLRGLADLKEAFFFGNPCIHKYAYTSQEIQELNLQLPIECPPSTAPQAPKDADPMHN